MLIKKKLEKPFDKTPKEDELPIISQTLINSQLTPQFWKKVKKIIDTNSIYLYFNLKNNNEMNIKNSKMKNNINYINNQKNKKTMNRNYSNYKKEENINVYKMKKVEKNKSLENIYNINKYIFNDDNYAENCENINSDNVELNKLKEMCKKLENDLKEKEIKITRQKEEKIILTEKIKKLEKMIFSLNSMDEM